MNAKKLDVEKQFQYAAFKTETAQASVIERDLYIKIFKNMQKRGKFKNTPLKWAKPREKDE